jgi:GTP cyclohydrolase IA
MPANSDTIDLQGLVRDLLVRVGENPEREGLRRTPHRFAKALEFLTSGYRDDPERVVNGAVFEDPCDEMVVVRDIELYSLCEHHLLPFFVECHIAYIPNGRIIGLSKLPRLVDVYARRLQVQERLTAEIANAIQRLLKPKGVGVVIRASHLCMMMRGVQKQHSKAVTSCMLGGFKRDMRTRAEFLNLLHP